MVLEITSTSNTKYKYMKSLHQKKMRIKHNAYIVEGIKSVNDAIRAGKCIMAIAVSKTFYETKPLDINGPDIYKIADHIFDGLCDTDTPQGILAVIQIERNKLCITENKPYIYCDSVTDPGNLGTIIRTADAAGFGGVFLSNGCADLYNPKTVRSGMGSFFHIDVMEGCGAEFLYEQKRNGFQILCGALGEKTVEYTDINMKKPTILVVGNEANGISEQILQLADFCVKIPIAGSAESLNVSIAAGILMYELLRQRRK